MVGALAFPMHTHTNSVFALPMNQTMSIDGHTISRSPDLCVSVLFLHGDMF